MSTTEDLLKVVGVIKYGGKLIYEDKGLYYWRGKSYPSLLEAQKRIDRHTGKIISKSIERGNKLLKEKYHEK